MSNSWKAELLDSSGQPIEMFHWYKIMLADGKELGIDSKGEWVKVYPAGQGMVAKLTTAPKANGESATWLTGEPAYMRAAQVQDDGTQMVKDISLSGWSTQDSPPSKKWLACYGSGSTDGYAFRAEPRYGNRMLLYADADQTRGLSITSDNYVIGSHSGTGPLRVGLYVAFVRVGGGPFTDSLAQF